MKILRVLCCLFALLLTLIAFAFSPRAHAAASGSTTAIRFTFFNQTAEAIFSSFSSDGCTETFVELDGTHNNAGLLANVFGEQFNACTGTVLKEFQGSTSSFDFRVTGDLGSASLSATITALDLITFTTFPLSVNMSWTATGPLSRTVQSIHIQTQNFIANGHTNGDTRNAEAAGTVSDGTTNFTASPSVDAHLMSLKSGSVQITHP